MTANPSSAPMRPRRRLVQADRARIIALAQEGRAPKAIKAITGWSLSTIRDAIADAALCGVDLPRSPRRSQQYREHGRFVIYNGFHGRGTD